MNKYRAIRTTVDGITFASKKEAYRFATLRILEKGTAISNLEVQPVYPIEINGRHICNYIADFRYTDAKTGKLIIEDTKGMRTPVFNLKKRLVEAIYGLTITIT